MDTTGRVKRGEIIQIDYGDTWILHPYDYLAQLYEGKLPLYTRYTLGTREAERDKRRYG